MVPDGPLSRRQLLAAGGSAGALLGGGYLARRFLPTAAASPSGWPMAGRDPAGTGYAPDADAPTEGVDVRWRQPLPTNADLRPSPVVANGVVYAAGLRVLAASATDGARIASFDRTATAAPTVAPGRAYDSVTAAVYEASTFDSHRLVGLHGRGDDSFAGLDVGPTRWKAMVESVHDSYSTIRYGGGARPPPVAVGDALLTFFRGTLAAVDASSGAVEWSSDENLTAVRPAVRDGTAYVAGPNDAIRSYDVETGEWARLESEFRGSPRYFTATPERLLVAGDGSLAAVSDDGRVEWQSSLGADGEAPVGPMAAGNGTVYARRSASSGVRLCAVDASDGETRWTCDDLAADADAFLPAATDETVVVPTADSGLAGVDAADGTVRWRFDPGDEACSPAALAGDALFVVTDEHLYALEEP